MEKQLVTVTQSCSNVTEPWAGTVGLGLEENNGSTSLFQNMIKQGLVTTPVFGIWINRCVYRGCQLYKV